MISMIYRPSRISWNRNIHLIRIIIDFIFITKYIIMDIELSFKDNFNESIVLWHITHRQYKLLKDEESSQGEEEKPSSSINDIDFPSTYFFKGFFAFLLFAPFKRNLEKGRKLGLLTLQDSNEPASRASQRKR